MEWLLRPVSSEPRVGEQMALQWKLLYSSPEAASAFMFGVAISEP